MMTAKDSKAHGTNHPAFPDDFGSGPQLDSNVPTLVSVIKMLNFFHIPHPGYIHKNTAYKRGSN